jgi:hypothetical protein
MHQIIIILLRKVLHKVYFGYNLGKACKKDKIEIVESKYNLVKKGLTDTFSTTENLIKNFENKSFVSLQRYMVLITASRILRKFLFLSEAEQSKLIEVTISKLGGFKK